LKEYVILHADIAGILINAIIFTATAVIGLSQLFNMKKARYADSLKGIFDEIHNISSSKDRDTFFKMDLNNCQNISYADRVFVENIIDNYTKISYIAYRKMIPRKYIFEMYSGLFIKMYEHSKVYIERKRQETGLINYAIYLEGFYYECLKYRQKRNLGIKLRLDRTKRFDLLHSD